MRINIKYIRETDVFEIQSVEKKLRAHFLLTRAELNSFRTMLEKALLDSKKDKGDRKNI